MLEFIGIMTIIYLIAMGLARLFGSKQPICEVYIIKEYEIEKDTGDYQEPGRLSEEQETHSQATQLPNNMNGLLS